MSSHKTIDTAGIATMLGLTREHVTDRVVKMAGFPLPIINTSQRNRLWSEDEVLAFVSGVQDHVIERPAGAASSQVDLLRNPLEEATLLMLALTATEPRPAPGVYVLLDSTMTKIMYVGQSGNVLSRMAGHQGKQFHHVRMIRVDDPARRTELEVKLIATFRPPLNRAGVERDTTTMEPTP